MSASMLGPRAWCSSTTTAASTKSGSSPRGNKRAACQRSAVEMASRPRERDAPVRDVAVPRKPGAFLRRGAKYPGLRFFHGVGPFVDERAGVVSGPWHAELMMDGKQVWACGMDTIMFRDGKIIAYWTLSKHADEVGRWSSPR